MSEIRANTVSDAAGTGPATLTGQYAAKAWVNFNGTGTVAIRESGNVSSITDNGTGDYTANFTSAISDINYSVTYGVGVISGGGTSQSSVAVDRLSSGPTFGRTTTSSRMFVMSSGLSAIDNFTVNVTVTR